MVMSQILIDVKKGERVSSQNCWVIMHIHQSHYMHQCAVLKTSQLLVLGCIYVIVIYVSIHLQCFDAVGWVSERASGQPVKAD